MPINTALLLTSKPTVVEAEEEVVAWVGQEISTPRYPRPIVHVQRRHAQAKYVRIAGGTTCWMTQLGRSEGMFLLCKSRCAVWGNA